jgi:hypothetical protein
MQLHLDEIGTKVTPGVGLGRNFRSPENVMQSTITLGRYLK